MINYRYCLNSVYPFGRVSIYTELQSLFQEELAFYQNMECVNNDTFVKNCITL